MKIIFNDVDGNLIVTTPSDKGLSLMDIEDIAKKVVPIGLPFKIIDNTDLPADRAERGQWVVNDEDLTDGTGGEDELN